MSDAIQRVLQALELAGVEERWTTLCFLAGQAVELDEAERHAALRRAELLLAAGGDPRRALELDGRAVSAVARDLDSAQARGQLQGALVGLESAAAGVPAARAALEELVADSDLAWRCYACALLAEELSAVEG